MKNMKNPIKKKKQFQKYHSANCYAPAKKKKESVIVQRVAVGSLPPNWTVLGGEWQASWSQSFFHGALDDQQGQLRDQIFRRTH